MLRDKVDRKTVQIAMHHRSVFSQEVYTEADLHKAMTELKAIGDRDRVSQVRLDLTSQGLLMFTPTESEKLETLQQRASQATTFRATSPALEEILYQPIPVLDAGFVRVVDYMGDDNAVVQGARVSYGKGTRQLSDNRGLIRYLMRHRHTTPFELAELKLHARAPIFVTRQWFRHRTASINEYSARYSVLEREFYTPSLESIAAQSSTNKQGRGTSLDPETAQRVVQLLKEDAAQCYDHYLWMLNESETGETREQDRAGLARELARINLPVSVYTQFYWKVNLWNLLHFLSLRADAHAQFEIRAYAEAILGIVEKWVPIVFEAFQDFVRGGANLSRQSLDLVRAALGGGKISAKAYGLAGREMRELLELLPELAGHIAE